MTLIRSLMIAASALTLSACAVGPAYHAPVEPPVALTTVDPQVTVASPAVDASWWRTFGDPELDGLIERALASNAEVRIAVARVREARALFRDTELDRFPRVTTGATYLRGKEQAPGVAVGRVDVEQADIGFDAAWEIDLFGRVGHQVDAARADAEAASRDSR